MEPRDIPPHIPHVTDDDFLSTFFEGEKERWEELARTQPELAREIEQRANRFRIEFEEKSVSPIELQREVIDFGTFLVSAIKHALETKRAQETSSEHTDPPLSA